MEQRLQADNREYMKSQTQLQELVRNVQTIHAELEQAGDNEKRRLERQVKSLETQL